MKNLARTLKDAMMIIINILGLNSAPLTFEQKKKAIEKMRKIENTPNVDDFFHSDKFKWKRKVWFIDMVNIIMLTYEYSHGMGGEQRDFRKYVWKIDHILYEIEELMEESEKMKINSVEYIIYDDLVIPIKKLVSSAKHDEDMKMRAITILKDMARITIEILEDDNFTPPVNKCKTILITV